MAIALWVVTPFVCHGQNSNIPYTFRLKNVSGFERTNETVTVDIPEDIDLTACTLQDEQGNTVPFEVTANGQARFQATVGSVSTAGYQFVSGTPQAPATLTYSAIKVPSTRADIAWENDLCAYRMYSTTLLKNEPNTAQGVDVWQKKQAAPVIDAMYNLSNYHNESQYGVDAYSVNGKRLGCGGTAAVVDGQLLMHAPYSTCTIEEQGALQQRFTLTYNDIVIDGDTYTKHLTVETTAGALLNKATLRLEGPEKTIHMAVAIYEHTDMSGSVEGKDFTDIPGLIGRAELKSEGSVTSTGARFYQGAYVPGPDVTTQLIDHHLCLVVDYTPGTDLVFYFGAGWNQYPAGRYLSDEDWFAALETFKSTVDKPLTLTSFTTLPDKDDVLAILNTVNQTWQQRNPTHGDYFWNRAVYHIGNVAAYKATGDEAYRDFSTAWAQHNNWWGATGTDKTKWQYKTYGEGANWVLFGDNQVCFQVYADLYNLDPAHDAKKIERALEVMGYEINTTAVDYLWWVDGLFMVMPIMTKLYAITGDGTYLDKMYAYWRWGTDLMCDEDGDDATGLYFRDAKYLYPSHQTNSGKKDFWARGNGWIFACFATILSELPETDAHREEYIYYYRRLAASLKQCQQPEGYWTRSILDPSYAPGRETSGTALFAYGFAWGINNGILSETEYGETLERAWDYLSAIALQPNGTVGYIQPIGEKADPNQTLSATSYYDFGVGAYLLAAAEMSRLAVGDLQKPKLRLANATMGDANEIIDTFNNQPDAEEATQSDHYLLDGQPIDATAIDITSERTVTLTLRQPLDYGRYTLEVSGIHSAEGGEMADGQTRTLLLTVPLTAAQSGISVTAIGAQSGNPATNVIDNNLGTRWSQQGTSGQWLQINLGSTQTVEAVDIAFYQGTARVAYFDIQTSVDGKTFDNALTSQQSSGTTNEMERYHLTPTQARYVRIVCNGTSAGDWNSITEVRVRVHDSTLDDILLPAELFADILLPTETAGGNTIVWTTSNRNVLTGTGLVTQTDADQSVSLTATVGSTAKRFDVTVKARNPEANLQLRYAFDDQDLYTDGNQVYMMKDLSTHARDAQVLGTTASIADGQLDLTRNTATGFSTNSYLLLPAHLLDSLRSYTVALVATPATLEHQPRFYDFGSASGNSLFLRAGTLAAGLKYNNGTTTLATADAQLTTGVEQQIAVTFDAKTYTTRIYVDGTQVAETTNITREPFELTRIARDTRNYIGRTQWWSTSVANDNHDYQGTINDFQLYNIALTPEELASLFSNITTDIKDFVPANDDTKAGTMYDLSGRIVNGKSANHQIPRGIYIVRGRKVVK